MALLSTADIAGITATVASALNTMVTPSRNVITKDAYGHDMQAWTQLASVAVNIVKPTATQLQSYAGIIGAQRALMMRFMQTSDIQEYDRVPYDGKTWLVQAILNEESFTVTREAIMTVVA